MHSRRSPRRPSASLVVALIALFVALDGASFATGRFDAMFARKAGNANRVDGLSASRKPHRGRLLALGRNGKFPASVIPRSAAGVPGPPGVTGPQGPPGPIDSTSLLERLLRDGAPDEPSLRTLGDGANEAAAGDDARFPTAGQRAGLAGTSGTPGALNPYVTDIDARVPAQEENNALLGTAGMPGLANRFVTNADPRNTDARVPTGPASGDLAGAYPAPRLAAGAIDSTALFADDATPAVRVTTTGFQINSRLQKVGWNVEDYDVQNLFSGPGTDVVAPVAGLYLVAASLDVDGVSAGAHLRIDIGKGRPGATTSIGNTAVYEFFGAWSASAFGVASFAAGEAAWVEVIHNSTGTPGLSPVSNMSMTWIGPG